MAPPEVPVDVFSSSGKVSTLSSNTGYSKRAYVTFLAGNGDYWKGVVGLAKGLRKVKSAYPLVVAILPDVPEEHREILRSQGCIVREIEPINPPENQIEFAMAYYVINYSKLRIWNFEEYSKMVYIDADIQVYDNIDNLFDAADGYFYAVMDCFCEKTWSHSPQYSIGYCQQCPDKVTWPAEMGSPPPLYFNAGFFVFEPSRLTYENLLETLRNTPPTPFAEQDFLNMFFQSTYKPIPLVYNLVLAMLWRHPENVELDKVKVVHYCAAGSKPWRYTGIEANMDREDIKMLVDKWWDVYNDASLDFKAEEAVPEEELLPLQLRMPKLQHLLLFFSLILFAELFHPSSADVGTASQYSPPYTPTACFGSDSSQFPSSNLFAAAGEGVWDNGAACGRQYLVRCISAVVPRTCVLGETIQVRIVDRAQTSVSRPSKEGTTIVLSTTAYSAIADSGVQSINIEFQQV